MPFCHACKKEIVVIDRVGRRDECESCGADLHCCFNCEFYDRSYNNECRESMSMRVVDKERSNFCDFFKISEKLSDREDKAAEAKRKLAELFRKK